MTGKWEKVGESARNRERVDTPTNLREGEDCAMGRFIWEVALQN